MILLGYLVSLTIEPGPDGVLGRMTPFVPPLASMTMPARMLLGHPAPWELPVSAAVTLAATYGLVRLAGRAYSGNHPAIRQPCHLAPGTAALTGTMPEEER